MNDKESRNYQRFVRVHGFAQAHASDFAPGSLGTQTFAIVGAVITEIDGLAAGEVSAHGGARQGTETRAQARVALHEDLVAINRTARAMANDVPGINEMFRMPRGNNDRDLINAARAFLADATPLKAQFIAHELPADFLEDLQADIEAMESAIRDQRSIERGRQPRGRQRRARRCLQSRKRSRAESRRDRAQQVREQPRRAG